MNELQPVLIQSMMAIVTVLIGIATEYLVVFLKSKGIDEKLKSKERIVRIGINAVEQLYQELDGPAKLQKAKEITLVELGKNNIHVDETELEFFMEGIMGEINKARREAERESLNGLN